MALHFHIIPVTAFTQNSTILWCDQTQIAAIVDPGGDIDTLTHWVQQQHLKVEKVLLTHGHIDHVGGAGKLATQLHIPIEGPEQSDRFWLDQLALQSQHFHFPPAEAFTPDRWLINLDTVTVGKETLQVRHCPGHTPGHIVFYSPSTKLLIAGDVIFRHSIGRTDFPMGDHQQLISAIQTQLFCLPDDTQIIPGHGPMTTIGEEKQHNPFVR